MYHVYWNQAAAAYSSLYFFIFLSVQFSTLKFFVTLFLGTMRPRRLKLGIHMDSGQMYHVYQNQAAALIHPFISSFYFLSNFQHWNFSSLFSWELWGLEDWNLVHTWTLDGCMVYTRIRLLLLIHSFVTLFSGTVRPRKLKLGAHMDNGWMYHVYQNQAAAAYLFLYFFIFLSLKFSNIKMFLSHLFQELWGLEGWNVIPTWAMSGWIVYTESFHNIFLQN